MSKGKAIWEHPSAGIPKITKQHIKGDNWVYKLHYKSEPDNKGVSHIILEDFKTFDDAKTRLAEVFDLSILG